MNKEFSEIQEESAQLNAIHDEIMARLKSFRDEKESIFKKFDHDGECRDATIDQCRFYSGYSDYFSLMYYFFYHHA